MNTEILDEEDRAAFELIDAIAEATGESKRLAEDVLNATLETIEQQVKKGERVSLPGFGTFDRRARSARTARNPRTGEDIKVPASKIPAFKVGSRFKESVTAQQAPKKPQPRDPKPSG